MSLHAADATVRRYGATNNSALDDAGDDEPPSEQQEPNAGHVYFTQSNGRKSSSISRAFSRWKQVEYEGGGGGGGDVRAEQAPEPPLIPSALEHKGEPSTTPLPKLPMTVLSIVCAFSSSQS